jgi:hypothetical protein
MDLGAAGAALLQVGGGEITALTEEVHTKRYTSWSRRSGRTPHTARRPALRPRPPPGPFRSWPSTAAPSTAPRTACGTSSLKRWGGEWHQAQSAALGLNRERLEETCRAALKLYGLAVDNVYQLLDGRQRDVANHARLFSAAEALRR